MLIFENNELRDYANYSNRSIKINNQIVDTQFHKKKFKRYTNLQKQSIYFFKNK